MDNTTRLAQHFISLFRGFFHDLPMDGFLTGRMDQRCHLISHSLLWWELYMLFTPEQIKVDFFDLLCIRGGTCFHTYTMPTGVIMSDKKEVLRHFTTLGQDTNPPPKLFCDEKIGRAYQRFKEHFSAHPRIQGKVLRPD